MDCDLIPQNLKTELVKIVSLLKENFYVTGSIAMLLYLCYFEIPLPKNRPIISDIDIALIMNDIDDVQAFGRKFSKIGYKWKDGMPMGKLKDSYVLKNEIVLDLFRQQDKKDTLAPIFKNNIIILPFKLNGKIIKIPLLIPSKCIELKHYAIQNKPYEIKHQIDLLLLEKIQEQFILKPRSPRSPLSPRSPRSKSRSHKMKLFFRTK